MAVRKKRTLSQPHNPAYTETAETGPENTT